MSESQNLICAATGCKNPVRRSGERIGEPMVALVLFRAGLEVRVATCEEHPLPPIADLGLVTGFEMG